MLIVRLFFLPIIFNSNVLFASSNSVDGLSRISKADLCPVSTVLNINNKNTSENSTFVGDYIYPINIYGNELLLNQLKSSNLTVDCYAPSIHARMEHFSCPLTHDVPCPVIKENIADALNITSDYSSSSSPRARMHSSLCQIKQRLSNASETVRVIVFGGSVTVGTWTDGCCSARECHLPDGGEHSTTRCAWPHFLGLWMSASFAATVEVHNVGQGGVGTQTMADLFSDRLRSHKIDSLTSSDIVFIDHSANDNAYSESDHVPLARGLEALIRHLYVYSVPHDWPTIVLLSVYPQSNIHGMNHYSFRYREVAAHYDLPLWSLRDAVLSPHSREKQRSFHPAIMWGNSWPQAGFHPPWHVHLFMSDFIGALLLDEMTQCSTTTSSSSGSGGSTAVDSAAIRDSIKYSNRTLGDLPPPMTKQDDDAMCDPAKQPYLFMSYESVRKKHHQSNSQGQLFVVVLYYGSDIYYIHSFNIVVMLPVLLLRWIEYYSCD